MEAYPLPRIEDLFASLAGGTVYYYVRSVSCLPLATPGKGVKAICDCEHTQGSVSVSEVAV